MKRIEPDDLPKCPATTYIKVPREWARTTESPHANTASSDAKAQDPVETSTKATTSFAMQRWQGESMRDQPYNAVGAVALTFEQGGSGVATERGSASSVQHLNRESRSESRASQVMR